jgi:hypothetical protein
MALFVNGELVDEALLSDEAASLLRRLTESMPGEPPTDLERRAREWAEENVIERILLRQATANDPALISGLSGEDMIHAAHIVKNVDELTSEGDALRAIRAAQLALEGGATFEEIAERESDCPGNGDLGCFTRGAMVEEFERIVFALEPGEVSDVFRSPFGFHIAKVYERFPAVVDDFVDRLRARAEIRRE